MLTKMVNINKTSMRGVPMDLLYRIQCLFGTLLNPTEEQLACAMRELQVTANEVMPYILEPGELPYGRNNVYQSTDIEVVILNLPANSCSAIHDHGVSYGCEIVVEGELVNRIYSLDDRCLPRLLNIERYQPNDICIIRKNQIHSIANEKEKRLVTLNVYSPPLQGCSVYPAYHTSMS